MLKTVAKKRVGRFLDGLFGDDDGGTGYNTPVSGIPNPIGDLVGRIFPFNLDTDEVMRGFLKPENVAVHVAQNTVNYISSSLAWLLLSMLPSQTQIGAARDVDGTSYHSPVTTHYTEPATGYSISESTHPFASASAANEVRSGKLSSSTNAREQPETSLEEAEQAIAEEKEKMKQTERLYELQVQEYRRRKKMEALKRKMELQAAAASEHISSTAAATAEDRQFIASSSYEEDLAAPPPQPELTQSQMQAKVETYQKYLQKKQNQMLQRRHSDDSIEYIVSHEAASQLAPMSVQVKSKGAGGPMRRKRK